MPRKTFNMHSAAHLAAVWSLNKALESNVDFNVMITACTNVIENIHFFRLKKSLDRIEASALTILQHYDCVLESFELMAVAKLYACILRSRFSRGMIQKSIELSYIVAQLAAKLNSVPIKIRVLYNLAELLFTRQKFEQAVAVVRELDFTAEEDTDSSGKTWVYAFCMDMCLDTGITIIPFSKCERFYSEQGEQIIIIRDSDAINRYFACVWLWHVRNENWEAAQIWYFKVRQIPLLGKNSTLREMGTSTRIIEGHILLLIKQIDAQDTKGITRTNTYLDKLMTLLQQALRTRPIFQCKYLLLKAYLRVIRVGDKHTFGIIKEARHIARRLNLKVQEEFCVHIEKAWKNRLSPIVKNKWRENCESESIVDWRTASNFYTRLAYYTYPLPQHLQPT